MPRGILAGSAASTATSLIVMVRLVFGEENTPSAKFTSAASTLNAKAAMALAFSITLSVAIVKRGAGHGGRARAAGAFAIEHLVGVALHVADLVRVEPEPVADQLLEHGFVALALAVRAGEQGRGAAAVEAHFGAFGAGGGGALDGVGDAEAAQLAALARLLAPLLEAFDVGELQRQIHVLFEFAAVVGERQRRS